MSHCNTSSSSRTFDIRAKATDSVAGLDAMLPMLKALLAERFRLRVHTESREMAISALVVARDDGTLGPNITRSTADCSRAERAVTPRAEQPAGSNTSSAATTPHESPSLMTALQEQLGLQLKAARGTVEFLVIDSAALPEPD